MKPGDLIEWRYRYNQKPVVENEQLYSTVEDRWVPIGEKVLLVSLVDGVANYLCSKGLFCVHVNDTLCSRSIKNSSWPAIPHVCDNT